MKKIILLFLMVFLYAYAMSSTIVLQGDKTSQSIYIKDGSAIGYKPGDTLLIASNASSIYLANIHGTIKDTVVISSAPGAIIGGATNRNLEMGNCSFFKLMNIHIEGDPDIIGCKIQYCTNFMLNNVNVYGASVGFSIKTDPNAQTQYPNSVIKDVAIIDCSTENTHNEGFYLGQTADLYHGFKTPPIIGLTVRNVSVTNAGWDGFQVTNAQNCDVRGVRVNNAGTMNSQAQRSGITIQDATTGTFSYLYVDGAMGSGLTVFSRGEVILDNIMLMNVGKMGGSNAIFIDNRSDRGYGLQPQKLLMSNVNVIGGAPNAREVMWIVNGTNNGAVAAVPGQIKNFFYDARQWLPVRDGARNAFSNDKDAVPLVEVDNTNETRPDTFPYAAIAAAGRQTPKPVFGYPTNSLTTQIDTLTSTTVPNCPCADTHDNSLDRQTPKPNTDSLTSIPSAPKNVTAEAGSGEVTLKWDGPDEDGNLILKGYKIFRGTRPNSFNLIHTVSPNDLSYVDKNRVAGTTYYYSVRAVNDAGDGDLSVGIKVVAK